MLDRLQAGEGEPGAAAALVARFGIEPAHALADAAAAAIELDALEVFPPRRRAIRAVRQPASAGTAWLLDRVIAPLEQPVRLRIASPRLARAVGAVLGPERGDNALAPVATIEARPGHELWLDGRRVLARADLMLARSELLRLLLLASGKRRAWLAILHAAAVSDGRAAVLLAGSSGSGKSTLAARLVASGLGFVTDDYAPLEAGGAVWPTPFGLSAKTGSWDLLAPLLPDLAACPAIRTRGRTQRYVEPPRREGHPVPVACLVFPVFQAGAACRIEALRPAEALAFASHGGAWFESTPERLVELTGWFARTPAYLLTYGDGVAAMARVRELLDGHAPRALAA